MTGFCEPGAVMSCIVGYALLGSTFLSGPVYIAC